MAEENGAPAAEAANGAGDAAAAATNGADAAAGNAGEKLFTQEDFNKFAAAAKAKLKQEAIEELAEKKADEKAAEALSKVAELSSKLEASEYAAQLARLEARGADLDLMSSTGLKGAELDAFAEKLIAKSGGAAGAAGKPAAGSASHEAAIKALVNSQMGNSSDPNAWKADTLAAMAAQVAQGGK